MEINHREVDEVVIVDILEKNFEHPKGQMIKNHVGKIMDSGKSLLVFNLSEVEMLDSFGIAVFISILKSLKKMNGNMTLFGLNEQVMHLMELTRMDRVLDIWETEGQAVAHVKP